MMTERAEILLPTPIIFPPMMGPVKVGDYGLAAWTWRRRRRLPRQVAIRLALLPLQSEQAAQVDRCSARFLGHLTGHYSAALPAE